MDTLSGSVERVTFYNPENGYTVLRIRPERGKPPGTDREGLVTITGNLPELAPGEHLHLSGKWINNPKYGIQFQVEVCEQTMPATVAGIRRYLGSGLIKGIGPKLAERIVIHFGLHTLEIIEENVRIAKTFQPLAPAEMERLSMGLAARHKASLDAFLENHIDG